MLLFPDPASAFEDPFTQHPTLNIICNVKDPVTGESYSRDPRYVAQKAEAYLSSTGVADHGLFRTGTGVLHSRRCAVQPGL